MQILQDREKQTEVEWDRRCVAEATAGLLLERQTEKKRKELQKQLAEENRQLAMEQKARWERLLGTWRRRDHLYNMCQCIFLRFL